MDNDERERRDWPGEDRGDQAAEPDRGASAEEPDRPQPTDETAPEGAPGAPAEIESWPSQEPVRGPDDAGSQAWPTKPPEAGSGAEGAWPTAAPERGEEPAWTAETASPAEPTPDDSAPAAPSEWEPEQHAPQEVEAYPAAGVDAQEAAAALAATPAHVVPDAEGTTGESTQCPRCGTENRPGLSFCRNCGQRLVAAGVAGTVERPGAPEGTMACPRCGTHNRAGVAFCQNCGANLRGTAEGYVPPAAAPAEREAVAEPARRGAVLGPVVLLIGLAGLVTGYLLPFLYGPRNSLFDRALGADGYGIAFWNGYPEVSASLADQAYFGLAGPVPVLAVLLLVLAAAGFVRATPGPAQTIGLVVALLWSVGLVALFVIVELMANWGGDLVAVLRVLTPAGIIFFLASLIVLIGTLTRFSRG